MQLFLFFNFLYYFSWNQQALQQPSFFQENKKKYAVSITYLNPKKSDFLIL